MACHAHHPPCRLSGLLTVAALVIGLVGYFDGNLDKMDSKLGNKQTLKLTGSPKSS